MGRTRSGQGVVIVEDHVVFAESLGLALTGAGHDVTRIPVPESWSVTTMVEIILRADPGLVLLDVDLGRFGDGMPLIAPLARSGVDVVVVTSALNQGHWGGALAVGARLVLSKSHPLDEVLRAVRLLGQGVAAIDVKERARYIRLWERRRREIAEAQDRLELLTRREQEVLADLMQGQSVSDIAHTSTVSEGTVRKQVKSILAKLHVSSQLAAVGMARRADWSVGGD